ncbi:RbsD/FucU family protein [Brachybacterium vulturis]|nr:RbsD/FucU family protein [Brachybacterium vulturis]
MKRRGILHPELSAHLARLGHTDSRPVMASAALAVA